MKYYNNYERIIAIVEKSVGNETVGFETRSFDRNTPISEIIDWAGKDGLSGKLIITIDEGSIKEEK